MNEIGALDYQIRSRGHLLLLSPKCHPELAGMGIEYSWGKIKVFFRSNFNNEKAKELKANVERSFDIVDLERVWKYARRTRDYMRGYELLASGVTATALDQQTYELIEGVTKKQKTHRNMMEIDSKFVADN